MSIRDNELILAGRMLGRRPKAIIDLQEKFENMPGEYILTIDGVLANLIDPFLEKVNQGLEPVTSLNDPRIVYNYHRISQDRDFWLNLPSFDLTGIKRVDLYITPRNDNLHEVTKRWLYLKGLPEAPIIHCEDRVSFIPRGAFVLEANGTSFEELRKNKVNCYLRDQPWNQYIDTPYRVFSIEEFYQKTWPSLPLLAQKN